MHAGVAEMEAVLAHHFRVGVWGFDDVPHSAPVWLFGPHQPTTWLAVPEAPLLCSSMCTLLPPLSPPPIGSHVRLFVSLMVSIDATRHRESCLSQLWVVSDLTSQLPQVDMAGNPVGYALLSCAVIPATHGADP